MAVFRKNDAWWIDYYYQGCRYRQKIGSRRKDAEEASAQIKVKIAAGDFVPPADRKRQEEVRRSIAFESFAAADFLEYSKVDHARSHHSQQRMIVNSHLIPYFGGMRLDEIVSKDIEKYKRMRSQRVSHSTVNRELFCLKKLFGKAVEWAEISENPMLGVKTFKETPKKQRLLELDEVQRLLAECKEERCRVDLYAFVCCIAYAGLRKAEVLNLRWDGIDHTRGHITVQSRPEWHTKNYQSRTIPMNSALSDALTRTPRTLRSKLVFPTPMGEVYRNTHYIKAALDRCAERAGIEGGVTFQQLRHTFCSHVQMQDVPPIEVQKWMGHRDLRTTLRYSHTSPSHEKASMARFSYGLPSTELRRLGR